MNQAAAESTDAVQLPRDDQTQEVSRFLVLGDTCQRIEQSERVSVLIDTDAYFMALRSALCKAQRHVFIIGWDVDSRTSLGAEDTVTDGLPVQLLPLLRTLLERRPDLHVYVLTWDFSVIYALEREWMPSWIFSSAHPRLHFLLDDAHVVGASQHQKLVVIDDALAFTGGIDLTIRRWDRPSHDVSDPARRDPEGEPYEPMHDVQICVDGDTARALAESARERWDRASRKSHGPAGPAAISGDASARSHALWPEATPYSFEHVPVGLSRTYSNPLRQNSDVHEIARLTERIFETARDYIYIENQYFTSCTAAQALIKCLEKPEGPEVILVLPVLESGWLEQSSMGVLRRQVLLRIRNSDRHGRLHMFYPKLPGTDHGLHIHCKLLIADDRLLKIGSANLSNRSLGLDTECDLSIETAPDDPDYKRIVSGIRAVLARLLAEHLALDESDVQARLADHQSLTALIEAAGGRPRCLERLPENPPDPAVDLGALGDWAIDPERPMAGETFALGLFPIHVRIPWLRGAAASVALIAPVLIMANVYTAHAQPLESWAHNTSTLVWLWIGYVLSASLFAPLSMLLGAICTLLDSRIAFGFALSGALLSASLSHLVGRSFKPLTLRWLQGGQARRLQHSARVRAVRATVIARLLPVGNFTASNLLAGALSVPFGRFCLGNLAGLAFGIALVLGFAKCALVAIQTPTTANVGLSCVAAVLLIALSYGAASLVGHTFSAAERAARNRPHQH